MVVLLITSFSLFFEKTTEKQILRYGQMTLDSGALYLDTMMESAKELVNNLSLDSDISLLLNYETLSANNLLTGLRRLYKYTSSSYLIDSIYVYNKKNNNVYVSSPHMTEAAYSLSSFPDFEASSIIQDYMSFNNLEPVFRVYNAFYPVLQEIPYISFIRYNNLSRPNESNVILVNIRQDVLSDLINKDAKKTGGLLFLIDSSGTSRIISGDETIFSELLFEEVSEKIERGEESFITKADGHKYIVCSSSVLADNARLVLVADENIVLATTETKGYGSSIILIGFFFFSTAAALILLFRRIWKVIENQFEAVNRAEEENRVLIESNTRGLLLSFLHSEKKAQDIPLLSNVDTPVTIIIAAIDYYETKLLEDYSTNYKRNKLKKDILDSFILSLPSVLFTTYETDERVIICVKGEVEKERIRTVKERIEQELSISLSLFISSCCTLDNVALLYDELCGGLPVRMLLGPSVIVDQVELERQSNIECIISDSRIKALTESILEMDEVAVLPILDDILKTISSSSYNSAQKSLINLFISLDDAFTKLFSNNGIEKNVISGNLTYKLSKLEYVEEIKSTISDLMESISDAVIKNKNNRQGELLTQIVEIVQEKCFSRVFSISTVAEELGMSASYLGKVFKKASGKSFSEYVLGKRMDEACLMLKDTDMTIDEIVYAVGFGDVPYFYKLFKKINGCTPVKYRQENKGI